MVAQANRREAHTYTSRSFDILVDHVRGQMEVCEFIAHGAKYHV